MSILVYIDHTQGQPKPASWEVLGHARTLAAGPGWPVAALVVGHNIAAVAEAAIAHGADQVAVVDAPLLAQFHALAGAAALKAAIAAVSPTIILAPATSGARDVAALAAASLNIGLAADCQGLALDAAGRLVAERAVFSGNMIATVTFRSPVQMATVRPRSFPLPAADPARTGTITPLTVDLSLAAAQEAVLAEEPAERGEIALEDADIVVAGGRGVKGPEGFGPLRALAATLGAGLGASRAAVDAGWIPYAHQVGQTGKTVRPKLYLAFGISGAIQHMAGMSGAQVIVAINKDKQAPIFGIARYGLIGDLFEIAPALARALEQHTGR